MIFVEIRRGRGDPRPPRPTAPWRQPGVRCCGTRWPSPRTCSNEAVEAARCGGADVDSSSIRVAKFRHVAFRATIRQVLGRSFRNETDSRDCRNVRPRIGSDDPISRERKFGDTILPNFLIGYFLRILSITSKLSFRPCRLTSASTTK
jgi:hypothetical protein